MSRLVLFTALDGALLDGETFSARPALPALDALLRRGAAVVPVSGRTAAQLRLWMRHLTLSGPFVAENGCAITMPKGYFPWPIEGVADCGDQVRIRLGEGEDVVRGHLAAMAAELGLTVRNFRSMTAEEVGGLCGLTRDEVAGWMDREHDEPFLVEKGACSEKELARAAEARGCRLRRSGPFFHMWRGCSKGESVRVLSDLYRRLDPDTLTAAIGEDEVDVPMLEAVDRAYLLRRPDGSFADLPGRPWVRVPGTGPQGWRMAAEDLLALWLGRTAEDARRASERGGA